MIVDDTFFNILALNKSLEAYKLKIDSVRNSLLKKKQANSGDQAIEKLEKEFQKKC
jgi:hypothetical protein